MLKGMRVAEVGLRPSVRWTGKLLADLGASVTRVEAPGDVRDPYLDHAKRTVLLEEGSTVEAMLDEVDCLIIGVSLPERSRVGLSRHSLGRLAVRVASITPFGESGDFADWRATDLEVQAVGGVSISVGSPDRAPIPYPFEQSGSQAGLTAAIALLGSWIQGGRNHEYIEISESDVWATFHTGTGVVNWMFHNRKRQRAGRRVADGLFPHQIFRCADGWIAIDCAEGRQWREFLDMIERTDLLDREEFRDRRKLSPGLAEAELQPWFDRRSRAEVFKLCLERRVPAAPLHDVAEVAQLDQLAVRGFFVSADGSVYPGVPFHLDSAHLATGVPS